jgi:hypothetical protein
MNTKKLQAIAWWIALIAAIAIWSGVGVVVVWFFVTK